MAASGSTSELDHRKLVIKNDRRKGTLNTQRKQPVIPTRGERKEDFGEQHQLK